MPWTMSDPPPNTGQLNKKQLQACVDAANASLERHGDEKRAIQACWAAAKNAGYKPQEEKWMETRKAVWDTKYINDLPDAAFAIVLSGGKKDDEGKTKPRSLRKLPHHDKSVKKSTENGSVDLPHLRNALARLDQTEGLSSEQKAKARRHLEAHAKSLLKSYQKALAEKATGVRDVFSRIFGDIVADHSHTEVRDDWDGNPAEVEVPHYYVDDIYFGDGGTYALLISTDSDRGIRKRWKLPLSIEDDEVTADWDSLTEVVVEHMEKGRLWSVKVGDEWFWISRSGSSFVDRDEESVSNRSIDSAIKQADESGRRGPLRLYHVPGTEVGDCLAQMRAGNFLLEVGKWRDTDIARKARKWADEHPEEAATSIGFRYRQAEKVKRGDTKVYVGPIEIVERSMVKIKHAANPWTSLLAITQEDMMGKKEHIAEIIGEDLAEQKVREAEDLTEKLVGDGLEFAEKDSEPAEDEEQEQEQELEIKADAVADDDSADEEPEGEKESEKEKEEQEGVEPVVSSDVQVLELDEDSVKAIGKEISDGLVDVLTKVATSMNKANETLDAMKELLDELNRSDEEKIAEKMRGMSRASLRYVSNERFGKKQQAEVEDPDAEDDAEKEAGDDLLAGPVTADKLLRMGFAGSAQAIQRARQ